jgi:hypothetical protein
MRALSSVIIWEHGPNSLRGLTYKRGSGCHFIWTNLEEIICRVIHQFTQLGGENGQFLHNRPSNAWLGMKILQNKIELSVKSGDLGVRTMMDDCDPKLVFPPSKLSFILSFLFPERLHSCYVQIYFDCSYVNDYYNYSWTLYIKCWVSAFHAPFNKISLLCGYH